MEFKILKIKDLQEYVNSEEYTGAENIPISKHRAISYVHNLRAEQNDFAIFMLVENHQIIAYRCVFPDWILLNNKKHKFYWISGSWVHPKFRRQGLSMKILDKVIEATDNKLMFSNYAPNSKSLYDKSNYFSSVAMLEGKRFYFKFTLAELLAPKSNFFAKIKPLLFIIDYILNVFNRLYNSVIHLNYKKPEFKEIEEFNEEIKLFIEPYLKNNLFKRNTEEFNHFVKFPWLITEKYDKEINNRYYFSSVAKRFFYKKILLRNEEGEISAFFIIKIRDNKMAVPYFFAEKAYEEKCVDIIYYYIKKYEINYFTNFNSSILKHIIKYRRQSLFSKKMVHDFFASKDISSIIKNENFIIFEGDGDNVYT